MARKRKDRQGTVATPVSTITKVDEERAGPESAGQSGDTQGLPGLAESESESVKELVEEGQYFEAAVVSGIENAPDADTAEVRTRETPEDDVPLEYQKREQD